MNYQETSREAWQEWLRGATLNADQKILHVIGATNGATDYEIETVTGLKHQTVSGNRRHLVERGRVIDSGRRDKLPNGRSAIVWSVPPEDTEASDRAA